MLVDRAGLLLHSALIRRADQAHSLQVVVDVVDARAMQGELSFHGRIGQRVPYVGEVDARGSYCLPGVASTVFMPINVVPFAFTPDAVTHLLILGRQSTDHVHGGVMLLAGVSLRRLHVFPSLDDVLAHAADVLEVGPRDGDASW